MDQPLRPVDRRLRTTWISLLLLLGIAAPVVAQTECPRQNNGWVSCATPWAKAPATLWGELQPADGSLPNTKINDRRDITDWKEFCGSCGPEAAVPWFMSVDVENSTVFTAGGYRLQIWDNGVDAANPGNPINMHLLGEVKGQGGGPAAFPFLYQGESSTPLLDVDAPSGVDNVVAIVGYANMGITIVDTTNKSMPTVVYQDSNRSAYEVYAARIGGTDYAFMAQRSAGVAPTGSALLVYNMDRAVTNGRCHTALQTCPGVLLGQAGTRGASYVDGVDDYVVYSGGTSRGYQILKVSNPSSPGSAEVKLTDLTGQAVYGVAMWSQGSSYYLGTVILATQPTVAYLGQIYDVSCIKNAGGCTSSPPLLWSMPVRSAIEEYVTFSRANGKPFLHFGSNDFSGQKTFDREFLVDVSSPSAARVVSPVGYFSWSHNYNWVWPGRAKFSGQYLYRAAHGVLDVHKLVGNLPPVANFSWSPAEVYPGTPVTFTDASIGQPTTWAWTFQDGSPGSSSAQAPAAVSFTGVGAKTISLAVGNAAGPHSVNKALTVLDPAPAIATATATPPTALVCQPVTFAGTGVTGRPTLSSSWQVRRNSDNFLVASGTGTTITWNTAPSDSAGAYTGTLTVSNADGSAAKTAGVTLQALPTLRFVDASPVPTTDPITPGAVKFHAPPSEGATTWQWDFGDGSIETLTDPITGPNPSHAYAVAGEKHVRVKIWNCVTGDAAGITSLEKVITVNPAPLIAAFQVENCFLGTCLFGVNTAVTFTDLSSGAQTWDYNWDGNDEVFEDAGHSAPVTSHTYAAVGSFFPAVRVHRGTEIATFKLTRPVIISTGGGGGGGGGGGDTKTITISGPSSGNVGAALTFSASGSGTGCTPGATSWSWGLGGGTATGATNGASVTISWSSAGTKSVTATNTGCSGATGNKSLTINNSSGGALTPAYSYSPSAPKAGQAVAFDATTSTGGATTFSWDFGDGSGAVTGSTASHTFAQDGNYSVKLSLTKSGSGEGCFNGVCLATLTKVVAVGTPLSAEFTTDAACTPDGFGHTRCTAATGVKVTLTATAADATGFAWDFGDSTTGSGKTVTKTWNAPSSYSVRLTVTRGAQSATTSRVFAISGPPPARTVVLPSVAQTSGALVQSSDLYVHNPGTTPFDVTLEFRKRGLPESNPPKATRTVEPGATLFSADVIREIFGRDSDQAGFVSAVVGNGGSEPVVTSFNTIFQSDGSQFGQTIPGVSTSVAGSSGATGPEVLHLVGLSDDDERSSYFGISNPNDAPATYKLRFLDKDGHLLGSSGDLVVSRFGQRQFQIKELRAFGVEGIGDYRVEINTMQGGPLLPYGAILRSGSDDPSFVPAERGKKSKVYLIGALGTPGLNDTLWQSDVVLSNITGKAVSTEMSFARVGLGSPPETPESIVLQPGATERLSNVLHERWGIDDATGVLSFTIEGDAGLFPVVQGDSYNNAHPERRFGQALAAFTDADAAGPGQGQYMVGMRQDENYRTIFWLFNPGTETGSYEVVYRKLDGTVLGRVNAGLPPGRSRQFRPADHPLPAEGVAGGFTVQVLVKSGKVLAAGQVVNNATNDPAYITGETR